MCSTGNPPYSAAFKRRESVPTDGEGIHVHEAHRRERCRDLSENIRQSLLQHSGTPPSYANASVLPLASAGLRERTGLSLTTLFGPPAAADLHATIALYLRDARFFIHVADRHLAITRNENDAAESLSAATEFEGR